MSLPRHIANIACTLVCASGALAQGDVQRLPPRVDVQELEFAARWAYADLARGQVAARQMELRASDAVQLRLDRVGTSFLRVRAGTGNSFNNSWDESVGLAAGTTNYSVEALSVLQRFGSRGRGASVLAEAGGIEFENGAGTEATSAADRAWLSGCRATWEHLPGAHANLKLTAGYLGDFLQPNFFARGTRLGQVNYGQAISQQTLSAHTQTSVEFDDLQGHGYLRGAFHTQGLGPAAGSGHAFADRQFIVEAIGRLSASPSFAWSTTASAAFTPGNRLNVLTRYSDLPTAVYQGRDGGQMLLNSGEVGLGRRGALIAHYAVAPGLVLEMLSSRRLDDLPSINRWRAFVALHFDAASLIRAHMMGPIH